MFGNSSNFNRGQRSFVCPKCNGTQYETDEIRTTGGGFSRFFDVQNRKFAVVSCRNCGYSELYKGSSSGLGNVADFLFGG